MKIYTIDFNTAQGKMAVELTAQQFSDLHDQLTGFYNDHYREIEDAKEDAEGVIEDEINKDHGNDNRI